MWKVWRFVLTEDVDFSDGAGGAATEPVPVEIEVPKGTELFGQPQMTSKGIVVYGLVPEGADDSVDTETRSFLWTQNNQPLPEGVGSINYRGTFKVPGAMTLHLFETTNIAAAA